MSSNKVSAPAVPQSMSAASGVAGTQVAAPNEAAQLLRQQSARSVSDHDRYDIERSPRKQTLLSRTLTPGCIPGA